jgi:stress response protein YsnF
VETGKVRLTKVVHERETLVDEPLFRDEVEVTRVPMQRVVDGPVPVREDNGTTILSVVEEVLVIEKRWMLREEIHLRTHRRETHQPQRITLRSDEVQVERVPHAEEET